MHLSDFTISLSKCNAEENDFTFPDTTLYVFGSNYPTSECIHVYGYDNQELNNEERIFQGHVFFSTEEIDKIDKGRCNVQHRVK